MDSRLKRLRIVYFVALSITVSCIISASWLIQRSISHANEVRDIKLAGRQHLHSQHLMKVALALPHQAEPKGLSSQPPRDIEYAYPYSSALTSRLNKRGEPENPLLQVADALFAKMGIPWHGVSYPAARVFENLRNGNSDFSMLVNSPALQACCVISKKPVTSTELRVYRLASQAPVTNRNDLAGKRVITVLGYTYGGLLSFLEDQKNNVTNNVAATHEAAFAMLARGRADYLIDYAGPSAEILAEHPIQNIKSDLFQQLDVYLALSKKRSDAVSLMSRMEAIMGGINTSAILEARPR
jgi:polar amino acid transport system substrate-binding protein